MKNLSPLHEVAHFKIKSNVTDVDKYISLGGNYNELLHQIKRLMSRKQLYLDLIENHGTAFPKLKANYISIVDALTLRINELFDEYKSLILQE